MARFTLRNLLPQFGRPRPSPYPGMGAVLYPGGVSFRVWAPHADAVFVAGDFDDWNFDRHRLAADGNGYWSTAVPRAQAGQRYKFRILHGQQELFRVDPYAREVTNSVGDSVIFDPAFDWDDDVFRMPA